ncbi:MAG: histidine kinase [Treponemataceae bacterium]|nr:histidine kinase [Treponemataceae bacterium]
MTRLQKLIISRLDSVNLRQKLNMVQVFCVILPLLITDSLLMFSMIRTETRANIDQIQKTADSVSYTLTDSFDYPIHLANNIYNNRYVNEFITQQHEDPLEYYQNQLKFMRESLFETVLAKHSFRATIYADNDSILNGGNFYRLSSLDDDSWYQSFDRNRTFYIFDEFHFNFSQSKRLVSIARFLDFFDKSDRSVLRIDLDYPALVRTIQKANYESDIYVVSNGQVILTNAGETNSNIDFEPFDPQLAKEAALHQTLDIYGTIWDIYVMPIPLSVSRGITRNAPLFAILVFINLLLPFAMTRLINQSFILRLDKLEETVSRGANTDGTLPEVADIEGSDEISRLMRSYNNMAIRMNTMIENEYIQKLKQQDSNLARQKAELQALHSQINPHFLFNALESIRMHSVLKNELETADMVEKLALMERQNVEWGNDSVKIRDELSFIDAYLELQRYRFGDKLQYRIDIADDCYDFRVPKLALVTFIENACIHGMEQKSTSTWIFLRVYTDENDFIMEIEDTGKGMSAEKCYDLERELVQVTMDTIQSRTGSIGLLNTALRLNIFFEEQVSYTIESEEGSGTMVTLKIPLFTADLMKLLS